MGRALGIVVKGRARRAVLATAGVLALAAIALAAWLAARAADPMAAGRVAYDRGDWTTAAEAARRRLRERRDDREALRLLARSSARLGRAETAQALFLRLGAANAGAEDFFLLGQMLLQQRDDGQAMVILERARAADPDHPEALAALIDLYERHDFPIAAADAARHLAGRPGWEARGSWALGRLELGLSDPRAEADLARALGRDPEARTLGVPAAEVRRLRARALLRAGRSAEALAALPDDRRDPEAAWLRGRAFLQQGKTAEARAAREAAGHFGRDDPAAAEPAPFVGAATCAACHPAIFRNQQASRHAHTFALGADLPAPIAARPIADPGNPAVTHVMARDGESIRVEARADRRPTTGQVVAAFGSGNRAVTPLLRDRDGRTREYRLTHYAHGVGWDLTLGHEKQPADPADYLGRPLIADRARSCYQCHTTDARAAIERTGPEALDRAIGCERCHGPGGHHIAAIKAGDLKDPAIGRPRLADADRITALCAQCHSTRMRPLVRGDDSAIRFQGTTLTWSRCYTESRGGLSCITCHDPHRDAETTPRHYEAICLDCHGRHSSTRDAPRASTCPVRPAEGCLECHMPTLPDVVSHTPYTDHDIRVRH